MCFFTKGKDMKTKHSYSMYLNAILEGRPGSGWGLNLEKVLDNKKI